jgi:excisionase family DNA binding protein
VVESADLTPAPWTRPEPVGISPLGEGLVTADVVAAHLSIDVSTIYKLARSGALPVVVIGRAKRFRVKDVVAFVESATRGGAQAARVDRVQQLVGGAARRRPSARSNDLDASRGQSVHRGSKQEPWRPPPPGRPEDN